MAKGRTHGSFLPCGDFRANTGVGEKFEQKRVGLLAVEEVDLPHAAGQRLERGIDLGDHAAGDDALFLEAFESAPGVSVEMSDASSRGSRRTPFTSER